MIFPSKYQLTPCKTKPVYINCVTLLDTETDAFPSESEYLLTGCKTKPVYINCVTLSDVFPSKYLLIFCPETAQQKL